VLIVDDASPDGTGEVADAIAGVNPSVSVLHRPSKDGIGPAYIDGFRHALDQGAAIVIQMDADFSHDPGDVPRLIEAVRSGRADMAIGSRYVSGGGIERWGRRRKALSRWGSRYAKTLLGVGIHDLTGGFKCMTAEVLRSIDLPSIGSRGYAFQVETTFRAIRAGFRVIEIPITFHDRRVGASKMSTAIMLEAVWRVPLMRVGRSPRPM
jgi:dolichol-phosphate mannosyltransferase